MLKMKFFWLIFRGKFEQKTQKSIFLKNQWRLKNIKKAMVVKNIIAEDMPFTKSIFEQFWRSYCKKTIFVVFHFLKFLPMFDDHCNWKHLNGIQAWRTIVAAHGVEDSLNLSNLHRLRSTVVVMTAMVVMMYSDNGLDDDRGSLWARLMAARMWWLSSWLTMMMVIMMIKLKIMMMIKLSRGCPYIT